VIARVESPVPPVPNCRIEPMSAPLDSVTVSPVGISVGPAAAAGMAMHANEVGRTQSDIIGERGVEVEESISEF
jgi:hypothetical protein